MSQFERTALLLGEEAIKALSRYKKWDTRSHG